MKLEAAQQLIKELIATGATHRDYKTVTDLATKLKILITGKGMVGLLKRYSSRETVEQFAQRVALTTAITPAVANSVKNPFNKVGRNDRIKKSITLNNNRGKEKQVEEMLAAFYGSKAEKNTGLDYWLKTRFLNLSFSDPNAWVAIEWKAPESAAEVVFPTPFEITAREAVNFKIVNGVTKWLLAKQEIVFIEKKGDILTEKDGLKYTLYDQDFTIVHTQVDAEYVKQFDLLPGQEYLTTEDNKTWLTEWFEPKVGFVPAFRVGYLTDESTNDRTFVNPFNAGMCFFDKSIKANSEFDLSMTLHAFPQKLQYVNKCNGVSKAKRCDNGYDAAGQVCAKCEGTGFAIHKSAQDAIYLKMPDLEEGKQVPNLDSMLVYKHPPIELLTFQNNYIQQISTDVHQAVFNSTALVRKTTATSNSNEPTKTATEIDTNMQGYYDAIEPYTEKQSSVYRIVALIACIIAGADPKEVEIEHTFPADPKLKNSDILLSELKAANESGAPSFLKDAINNDLADINFSGDKWGKLKYDVKKRFSPFRGKSEEQINMLLISNYVSLRDKVLYANFESIFQQLELENGSAFYVTQNIKKQSELLEAKISEFILKIKEEENAVTADLFRNILTPASGEGGSNNGDGNPGDEEEVETV